MKISYNEYIDRQIFVLETLVKGITATELAAMLKTTLSIACQYIARHKAAGIKIRDNGKRPRTQWLDMPLEDARAILEGKKITKYKKISGVRKAYTKSGKPRKIAKEKTQPAFKQDFGFSSWAIITTSGKSVYDKIGQARGY